VLCYQPLDFAKTAVVADKSNMIRGFTVPGLALQWETAAAEPIMIQPVKVDENNFIVAAGRNVLYCLNNEDGAANWDYQFNKALLNFAADEAVFCVTGYTDLTEPSYTLTGHSITTGELLWTLKESVSSETPLFIQGLLITTTSAGNAIVVNQRTGELVYKDETSGLKAVQILDDRLILLAAGGSRIICLSLMTGQSWTITMNSSFTGAGKSNNRIILANKKSVRCVNANDGSLVWSQTLEDIYNVFAFRKGVFITHKDSFFDRTTYGSYFTTESGTAAWTTYGKSIFKKPLIIAAGDVVAAYNGDFKLMPSTASEISLSGSGGTAEPAETTKKSAILSGPAVTRVATSTVPQDEVTDEENNTEDTRTLPNLEVEETGWTNEKP
jgi:outer membrane protein assembly factor BamB